MKKRLLKMLNNIKQELSLAELDVAFGQIQAAISNLPENSKSSLPTTQDFLLPPEVKGKADTVAIFSDGACRGNPGPGGWGYVIQDSTGKVISEGSGHAALTTNNQMELIGALEGMEAVLREFKAGTIRNLLIYTDSKYLVNGMNSWVQGWKARGWKKADKKTPENLELWQQLDAIKQKFNNVEFKWVKGHAGHPQNEYCDALANKVLDENGH